MNREGAGKRTYTPKHNSLRAKLLRWFAEHPGQPIARTAIVEQFGAADHTVQGAISWLRRDGKVKTLYGPNRTTFYAATGPVEVALPKPPKEQRRARAWSKTVHYTEPKPIPTSIFHYASLQ